MSGNRAKLAERRGELMAELLLEDLGALFVSRSTVEDLGFDLLAGFRNDAGGTNTFAIEVKSTEQNGSSPLRLERQVYERLLRSNTPALLLVANVKENRLYYGWVRQQDAKGRKAIPVPVVEVNEGSRKELRKELTRSSEAMAEAG